MEDPGSTSLIDELRDMGANGCAALTDENETSCHEIKREFKALGVDHTSSDLDKGTPWAWVAYYMMAHRVGMDFIEGRSKFNNRYVKQLTAMGMSVFNTVFANYNAWACGSQIFEFSTPLASKLLLSDCSKIAWEDFRLPFQSFVVQLPVGLALIHDPTTGDHHLDSIIITEGEIDGKRNVTFLFMARENENSVVEGDDATVFATIWCKDNGTSLEESIDRCNPDQFLAETPGLLKNVATLEDRKGGDAVKQLIRFAISLALYLVSHPEDRDRKNNPEVGKLHRKMGKLRGRKNTEARARLNALLKLPRPYRVGTKVTIDPNLQKVAKAAGEGRSSDVASYVRGHHKMQAHGSKQSLRKLIWIEPYWKNLHSVTTTQKTYKVK